VPHGGREKGDVLPLPDIVLREIDRLAGIKALQTARCPQQVSLKQQFFQLGRQLVAEETDACDAPRRERKAITDSGPREALADHPPKGHL
jgi:hypothetical protein